MGHNNILNNENSTTTIMNRVLNFIFIYLCTEKVNYEIQEFKTNIHYIKKNNYKVINIYTNNIIQTDAIIYNWLIKIIKQK